MGFVLTLHLRWTAEIVRKKVEINVEGKGRLNVLSIKLQASTADEKPPCLSPPV